MSIARRILEQAEPVSVEAVFQAFEKLLAKLNIENIFVEDVFVDYEGEITVQFVDDEDNEMGVLFLYDDEEGPLAIILDDEDADEFLTVDLEGVNPPLKNTPFGIYIDMTNLDWMNYTTLHSILSSAELLDDDENLRSVSVSPKVVDKHGYIVREDFYAISESGDDFFEFDESRKVTVVRGGKRVRLPVIRRKRRRVMTGKQRSATRKAARKRRGRQAAISRKRKRSLRVRKRMGIKKPKLTKFQKAAGTADRKR